uniref:Cytochrome b561 domain-containing protein n=1 Tax=Rhabditophanes sp. KR3021 TaxID=114890 RepID=A0AC35U7V3_9BILA
MSAQTKLRLKKLHGSFFIVAWFVFVLNAVNYIRYYKPFFEDSTIFGQKIWFQFHRAANIFALCLMICAFCFIFFVFDWKWQGPKVGGGDYNTTPGAIHSILGTFAFGLACLQVGNSFLRCAPGRKNRKIFNWIHRCLGASAFLLAVGTISIAAKFFAGLFSGGRSPSNLLYSFYAIIAACIITNEICTRFKFRMGLLISLLVLLVSSLIVSVCMSTLLLA